MIIPVGVSKRHVHITKETCLKLFNTDHLEERNPLNQPGQFASTSTVYLKLGDKIINHVRVVGPIRPYNQIEISQTEADYFGVNPPRRQSGDLENSLSITLVGPCGEVNLDSGLILAERHIHMDPETAKKLDLVNKEIVNVYQNDKLIFDALIKISDPAYVEIHIDTDEEVEFDLHQNDEVEFKKCGK